MNKLETTESQLPVIYRAVGWVAGTYQPSEENCLRGVLLTEDEQAIPAELFWRLRNQLKKKHPDYDSDPDFFREPQRWTVYPTTDPLSFRLVTMKPLHSASSDQAENESSLGQSRPLDQFRIVGEIESCASGTVNIRIRRNERPPKGLKNSPEYQPFTLTLVGSLPTEALGQIWELEVRRQGQRLAVIAGQPYQPSAEDLAWLEQQKQRLSSVKMPIKSSNKGAVTANVAPSLSPPAEPMLPVDALHALRRSPAVTPTAATNITSDYPAAPPNAGNSPTLGKMEVVVKINQFPDDVRTLDKDWKEFSVDTGNLIVTITVKPKVFAILEQAQQSYPAWVAAISGQMGEMTETGFRLESPTLKVFERKPQNSEPPKQTTRLTSKLQGPTPGKMELTIKINEFPASVRTVENGWRSFDVDSGDQLVTIAVKPKVFKKLVFAQENYPQWVAAIAGLRGETTSRGFVLLEPNIQVFERKPKDSATAEPTTTKDNCEPSPATESQQSPPETTPQQQPVLQPKTESQPQASPVAKPQTFPVEHPMQRPKEHLLQQRSKPALKNLGQNQQRSLASPSQEQLTTPTPNSKPQSEPPRFRVKVNDQLFQGYDSVTLNKRVVRVDGVTVGQAKMVIVLGQPRSIQADGGVTQGRNQAVLISR